MPKKRTIIILIGLGIAISTIYYYSLDSSCLGTDQGSVIIDNTQTITVGFAKTAREQAKGLSGCSSLKIGQGMYFPFPQKKEAIFWMKDMIIPIDIIWISDDIVVGIEQDVPPPEDKNLIKYYSPQKVNAVLEVSAGDSSRLGIKKGSHIRITKVE